MSVDMDRIGEKISSVIAGFNEVFDKEREQTALLARAIQRLGNPGVRFKDLQPFEISANREATWAYYLVIDHGELRVWTMSDRTEGSEYPLTMWSLRLVVPMLKRLPVFLQNYYDFLKKREDEIKAEHTSNLNLLTQVVEAVTAIVG